MKDVEMVEEEKLKVMHDKDESNLTVRTHLTEKIIHWVTYYDVY